MRSRDVVHSSFSDLVDHLHDLEELHERLIHLVGVLKTWIYVVSVIWWSGKNLEVDAVARLLNGTEKLCIVFRLHMILHHFHLGMFEYGEWR